MPRLVEVESEDSQLLAVAGILGTMEWLRKHWLTILGVLLTLKPAWNGLRWLVELLGDIDFIHARINDPGWVGDMIDWVANPPGWAILLMLIAGLSLIYLDTKRRAAAPFLESLFKDRDRAPRKSPHTAPTTSQRRDGDYDLVSRGLRLRVTVGKDGADITAIVTIRNRSLRTLRTESMKGRVFEIDGRTPAQSGGGLNLEMRAETEQAVRFGPIRILSATPGVRGHLNYAVRFGIEKDKMLDILSMKYNFTIKSEPKPILTTQDLVCEIVETIQYSKNTLTTGSV